MGVSEEIFNEKRIFCKDNLFLRERASTELKV